MKGLAHCLAVVCALVLSAEATKTANAAVITETIDFTARGFIGAPVDPVIGSFTITLDPAVLIQRATTVTFDSLNITPSAIAPIFDYIPSISGGFLSVCSTTALPGCTIDAGKDSFFIQIRNFRSTPTFNRFDYAQSSVPGFFSTVSGSVSVSEVPLPAALPLFATGLGALGLLGWRRKRKALAA
jgi:hypothetical protein